MAWIVSEIHSVFHSIQKHYQPALLVGYSFAPVGLS